MVWVILGELVNQLNRQNCHLFESNPNCMDWVDRFFGSLSFLDTSACCNIDYWQYEIQIETMKLNK